MDNEVWWTITKSQQLGWTVRLGHRSCNDTNIYVDYTRLWSTRMWIMILTQTVSLFKKKNLNLILNWNIY